MTSGFLYTSKSTFSFFISAFGSKIALSSKSAAERSHLVHFGCCHYVIKYFMRDMMDYHCLRIFRSRDRRIGKHSPGFFYVPNQSAWLFRCWAVPCFDPEPFVEIVPLTINLSHAKQVTYEVWRFHVTDGDVRSDWWECNGCFCRDGNWNNWSSIDDFCSAKISACRATSLPRMRKIICAEKEPGPPQEATPQTGWWTSFPLFTVW